MTLKSCPTVLHIVRILARSIKSAHAASQSCQSGVMSKHYQEIMEKHMEFMN